MDFIWEKKITITFKKSSYFKEHTPQMIDGNYITGFSSKWNLELLKNPPRKGQSELEIIWLSVLFKK